MTDSSNPTGIVYLVGAGPGHPGLITRWGYELLQHCDAVAYDALIPMELIAGLPEGIELYYVGKRAGRHSLPQSQINELLVVLARRGLRVVRLKGGDPFIYGRSSEEAEYLAAAGIPVVMIPGVTSASAAAALCGFSLTNRQSSSWVFMATGHGAENSSNPVPWNKVGALPGGTLVIYMGLAKLDRVVEQLLSSGLSPEIPAVAVQAASTGLQRCLEAPLNRISSECSRHSLKPPALVIIGEAVRSRGKIPLSPVGPLGGKTVLVLSPSRTAGRLCKLLREAGAEPIPHPAVVRKQYDDAESWNRFLNLVPSGGACSFRTESEVEFFIEQLLAHGLDLRRLGRFKIVAASPSAQSALLAHGIKADSLLPRIKTDDLADFLPERMQESFRPLVRVCGFCLGDSPEIDAREPPSGVISLAVFRESTAVWEPHWKDALAANPPDYTLFAGASEVYGFVELMGEEEADRLAGRSCVAAMNDAAVKLLARYGWIAAIQADAHGMDSFVDTLVRHAQKSASRMRKPAGHKDPAGRSL
jgi:uroporphyrinogen III methyltransferase/synthase